MSRTRSLRNAVVTGGAGFIGSHLCDALIQEGFRVICIDNLITGSEGNIAHLMKTGRFILILTDITKPIRFKGPIHTVFHFASPASPIDYLKFPIQTLKVGALGTHHTLGLAKEKKARFMLASTSEVYGDPEVHPQIETYWGHVNPIGPRGVYDEAKRFAEALALAYQRTHRMDVKIVRIFNTYGPRMRKNDGRAIPNFIDQALHHRPLTVYGRGRQTRSFCFIEDLIRGILAMNRSPYAGPVNLGNPRETDILKLGHLIIKLTGSRSKIVFKKLPVDDPRRRCPDISLVKRLLGWEPRVALDVGLRKTIDYFQSHKS